MRRVHALVLIVVMGTACSTSVPVPPEISLRGETMGTTWSVVLSPADSAMGERADDILAEIERRLERVNEVASTYRFDSELSRFNALQGDAWFPVSEELIEIVAASQSLSVKSEGAFDATVGPVVRLWNFGPDPQPKSVPTTDDIEDSLVSVGFAHLDYRDSPPSLKKDVPNLDVDLSAIAKGYGVDVVAEYLSTLGLNGYLVEIGGEMRVDGHKSDGAAWSVGIMAPVAQLDVYGVIELTDSSIATSGNYRNFFEHDGVLYSHTIDPRTGWPTTHKLAGVSVIADNCMEADGLATTLMVLGPDAGYTWAAQHGIAALFLSRDGDDFEQRVTPSWPPGLQRVVAK